jgi:putative tryptophan/tyrosine transport system substrate-binding protein
MKRRDFISLSAAAAVWPIAARAQQPMPVIGFLNSAMLEGEAGRLAAFRQGLKENGFVEGQNVAIEYRSAEGQFDRLPALAADLVRRQVSVLVANTTASALAAKPATSTLPIVFVTGGDPVELGLVASLNRPGGNLTGVSFLVNKLVAKRLELLSELAPGSAALGMLVDPNNPNAQADTKDAQAAATALGRKLVVARAGAASEIDAAFAALAQQGVSALLVGAHVLFFTRRDQLVALAARHAVAASYATREFVAAGGLMSYGPNQTDVYRLVGVYAGRILKGAKPADLPVERPVKFELAINLKTAKALGLDVPLHLQQLADAALRRPVAP